MGTDGKRVLNVYRLHHNNRYSLDEPIIDEKDLIRVKLEQIERRFLYQGAKVKLGTIEQRFQKNGYITQREFEYIRKLAQATKWKASRALR